MKLFNTIMSKIFGHSSASTSASAAPTAAQSAPQTGSASAGASAHAAAPSASPAANAGVSSPQQPSVDVNAVLTEMASKNSEKLDWKKSIVDLMKLVGMDSSLASRKELATELGYTGDQGDSATMNVWLHKQVLKKLAENGGKVPQNLLD